MGTSTCLLGFFLDFLTTNPVRLFLGSTCFLKALLERLQMSCLHHAWLYRVDVSLEGTKVSIYSMHLCLKSFKSTFTGVEVEKSLVNFSVKLAQALFHGLLVCPLRKVDLSSYWLLARRKNTGIHKQGVMVTYARQGNTPFYK